MNDLSATPPGEPSAPATGASTLDHLALLSVHGPDARTFLDSQLTRNVPPQSAPASLAGYCSPKGRLLASFVAWAEGDAIRLLVSRAIAAPVAKRLRMYVLRAKVTIDDGASLRLDGFVGAGPAGRATDDLAVWDWTRVGDATWLRFPDAAAPRFLRIASGDVPEGGHVVAEHWRWLDVRAGLPWITPATQDRFVPQMLNLEALGAVDFRKGCFPGQEVVARSQYLGKLKRRTALATSDAPAPAPGTDVWNSEDDREACGVVVNAESGPEGRTSLLIELPLASFASTTLRLASPGGAPLFVEPLPYPLPDNEVFVRPKL